MSAIATRPSNKAISIENDPAYAAENARLMELRTEQSAISSELNNVISNTRTSSGSPIGDAAQALVDGDRQALDRPNASEMNAELAELYRRRSIFDEAVRLQSLRVKDEEWGASKRVCAGVKDQYRSLVREMLLRSIELGRALEQIEIMTEALQVGGVLWTSVLRPFGYPVLGNPRERDSQFGSVLRDAIEHEFISQADVPAEWLMNWQ